MQQRTRWIGVLEAALCVTGVAATAFLLTHTAPIPWTVGVLGALLFVLAEHIEVDMRMALVTPGPILALAAAFVFGPAWAALWASIGALVADLRKASVRRPMTIALNASTPGLYTLAAVGIYLLLGGPLAAPLPIADPQVLPDIAYMLSYLLLNLGAVLGLYVLRHPTITRAFVWEAARWEGVTWLFAIPMVYATWLLYSRIGAWGVVFVLVPVALISWAFRLLWELQRENRINRFFAESSSQFDAPRLAQAAARLANDVLDAVGAVVAIPGEEGIWRVIGTEGEVARISGAPLLACAMAGRPQRSEHLSPLLGDLPVLVLPVQPLGSEREPFAYVVLGKGSGPITVDVAKRMVMQLSLAMERITTFRTTEAAALRDGLTGLLNHQAFLRTLSDQMARHGVKKRPVSVLLIDADHFKRINDNYGHPAGDAVICRLGAVMGAHCPPGGAVARMGGEEFAMAVPLGAEEALAVAESIRAMVAETTIEVEGALVRNLSVSIGVASYPDHGVTVSDLLARADQALYWGAKEVGRNRVALVSSDLDASRLWDQKRSMYTASFFQQKVTALAADAAAVGAGVGLLVLTTRAEPGVDTFSVLAEIVQNLRKIDDVPVRYNEDTVILLCPRTGLPHMRRLAERATRSLNGSAPGRDTWVGSELVAPGAGESAEALAERIRKVAEGLVRRQSTHLESNNFAMPGHSSGDVLTRLLGDYDAALRVLSQPSLPLATIIEQTTAVLAFKDIETQEHSRRVVAYSLALGRAMGLPETDLEVLRTGAWLHDVGKIGVPDSILKKPGPLTPSEWDMMKQHVTIGVRMLACTPVPGGALDVVRYHHERWDGKGYPTGLEAEEIPLPARIFAIADVFDAITHDRPYRKALSTSEARSEIARAAGTHLCPGCVEVFLTITESDTEMEQLTRYA